MRGWISQEIVPATVAADFPFVEDLVRLLGGKMGGGGTQADGSEEREGEQAGGTRKMHKVSGCV
jgi:hypothetical protein